MARNELCRAILELIVAMITSVFRSSGWTGYRLMEGRHDLPEVGFVKSPAMIEAASGWFVDVAAELFVEFGTKPSSCLPEVECRRQ